MWGDLIRVLRGFFGPKTVGHENAQLEGPAKLHVLGVRDEETLEDPARGLSNPLLQSLREIEETALSIYAANGLPTRPGQYARSPSGKRWRFVANNLTAEERWELFLANSVKPGWRFGQLEDLVSIQSHGTPELIKAAALLKACRVLQSQPSGQDRPSRSDEIALALSLGADWRSLQMTMNRAGSGKLRWSKPARSRKSA